MPTLIPLEPCTSSSLTAYGYDPDTSTLAVQFKNGHEFHYANVPAKLYAAMQQAPSKGKFYGAEIRGHFTAEKVTGACVCGDIGYLGETCHDCGASQYRRPEPKEQVYS